MGIKFISKDTSVDKTTIVANDATFYVSPFWSRLESHPGHPGFRVSIESVNFVNIVKNDFYGLG